MADEHLGDLIVEMKLDDLKYRAEVKRAVADTQAQVKRASQETKLTLGFDDAGFRNKVRRALGRSHLNPIVEEAKKASGDVQTALVRGFDAKQASQSLKALHGALYLVTGETGFMVVQMGQAAVHVGKLAGATGGLTGALLAAGGAAKAFLVSIGPIGWAIGGIGAAYLAYTKILKGNNDEQERAQKIADQNAGIYQKLAETIIAVRRARGEITETEARKRTQAAQFGRALTGAEETVIESQVGLDKELAGINAAKKERDERIAAGKRMSAAAREFREKRAADIEEERKKNADLYKEERDAIELKYQTIENRERFARQLEGLRHRDEINHQREMAIFDFKVRHGIAKPSEGMTDPVMKMLAQFDEQRAAELAAQSGAGGSSFGIGTQSASAFKFGPGAFGSVIGGQSEQTKTNDILKRLEEETKKQAANIAIIAREIAAGNDAFNGLPGM